MPKEAFILGKIIHHGFHGFHGWKTHPFLSVQSVKSVVEFLRLPLCGAASIPRVAALYERR
jgi:hypothetical protein